jgi:hypothetical protein
VSLSATYHRRGVFWLTGLGRRARFPIDDSVHVRGSSARRRSASSNDLDSVAATCHRSSRNWLGNIHSFMPRASVKIARRTCVKRRPDSTEGASRGLECCRHGACHRWVEELGSSCPPARTLLAAEISVSCKLSIRKSRIAAFDRGCARSWNCNRTMGRDFHASSRAQGPPSIMLWSAVHENPAPVLCRRKDVARS